MTVVLDGETVSLDDVIAVARRGEPVELAEVALRRMSEARAVAEEVIARGESAYGLTTGVGERKRIRLRPDALQEFNRLAILNTRVGQGKLAPRDVARATLVCLANGLGRGTAAVRREVAAAIVTALNEGFEPSIRRLGSVGQSDMVPMADLAFDLMRYRSLEPTAGDAIVLLVNNAFSTGWGVLAVADCEALLDTLDVAAVLELEAFEANLTILHPIVAESRGHPGFRRSLERLRELLTGSSLWTQGAARNLQDPLSYRCLPQVHGSMRDAIEYAKGVLETEVNSFQGNPVVVVEERRVISIANFDALSLAAALDFVRIVLASILTAANERMMKLLEAPMSGLAPGLATRDGVAEDALSEFGVAGQALTVEARTLAQPVSYELASSTQAEGIEDRTSMASLSARRLEEMVDLGARLVAVELVVAAQAVDLRSLRELGKGAQRAMELVRGCVDFTNAGQSIPQDLEPLRALIRSGRLAGLN